MKSRTWARSVALQALYEIDVVNHAPGTVWEERVKATGLEEKLADFAREIIFGVLPIRDILDEFIAEHAPEWPLDQVAIIDRNILRIALWEIAVYENTPIKVAINEAVEFVISELMSDETIHAAALRVREAHAGDHGGLG